MTALEALKRIRQETAPATYMTDFDKNECCDVIEKICKAIEVLQDGFSFASYNPNGDYVVISFTIKENCDRKLINETLFDGNEVLKCQKE